MAHIGIDARLTYYRVGGISTYIRRLIDALAQLDSDNRYTVFNSRKASEVLTTHFDEARLWTPSHHRLERLALSMELLRHRLDLYHSPDFIPPLHAARRQVITVHDLTFIHYPDYLTADSRRYYNDQIRSAVKQADHILSDSEATKRDLISILGVAPDKITVHMLGVDDSFRPLPAEVVSATQHKHDLPADYFLFVGTFEPRKNIIGLLQAYRALIDQMPDAPPLALVGRRGWLFDETMAQIASMGLNERILWRDQISNDDLPAIYNGALSLITPSFYEGFGLPALEAMACGTVPIVSDRASLPEVVGDVGLLINPDELGTLTDALARVLTDTTWRQQQAEAARMRARSFTWQNTAEITLSVYRSLLD